MINLSSTPDNNCLLPNAQPDQVLYYYDEPLIYTKRHKDIDYIFHKIDEKEDRGIFLVASTSTAMLHAIIDSRASVRSAFLDCIAWIIVVTSDFVIDRSWMVHTSRLEDDVLPGANIPLDYVQEYAPDVSVSVPRTHSFLSFKFQGDRLSHGSMPLNVFKGIVDDVYGSLRTIFIQPVRSLTDKKLTEKAITQILNIPVHQPVFASLRIDVEMPTIDRTQIKDRRKVNTDLFNYGLAKISDSFVSDLEIMKKWLEDDSKVMASSEQFHILDALFELVPKEASEIEHLSLQARDRHGKLSHVEVDVRRGERIRAAHERLSRGIQTRDGKVVAVNQPSETFILETKSGRGITCLVEGDYDGMRAIDKVFVGLEIQVAGNFTQRAMRDYMTVHSAISSATGEIYYLISSE